MPEKYVKVSDLKKFIENERKDFFLEHGACAIDPNAYAMASILESIDSDCLPIHEPLTKEKIEEMKQKIYDEECELGRANLRGYNQALDDISSKFILPKVSEEKIKKIIDKYVQPKMPSIVVAKGYEETAKAIIEAYEKNELWEE